MPAETIYRGHSDKVFAVAWSPDGRYIASGSRDKTVHVWHAASGTCQYIYRGHTNCLLSVAWSPTGKQLASGCTGGLVHVWHAFTGDHIITYRGHSRFVRSVAWSPGGQYIASAGDYGDNTVQVWESTSGKHLYTHDKQYRIFAARWSPDGPSSSPGRGPRIASASFDGTVHVWDAFNGEHALIYREHSGPVYALAWSPGGRCIISAGHDTLVRVWNAATGKTLGIYEGHTGPVKALACSPDGHYIASGGNDTSILVQDSNTGNVEAPIILPLENVAGFLGAAAPERERGGVPRESFSPNFPRKDEEPNLVHKYSGHTNWVRTLDWSPAGTYIASASDDTVHVWPFGAYI